VIATSATSLTVISNASRTLAPSVSDDLRGTEAPTRCEQARELDIYAAGPRAEDGNAWRAPGSHKRRPVTFSVRIRTK
jgi:hypothetical protein